jgi:serine/threonine protein phosphatase 1
VFYAIGDVHGEVTRLKELHAAIFAFHGDVYPDLPLKLVHLGDYIDRGPDSAGVIQVLMSMEADGSVETVNLRGNHEQMMLDAYDQRSDFRMHWLTNGGDATLESYIRRGHQDPPESHLDWVRNLPTLHLEADRRLAFVHAGVDPQRFPDCSDEIRMWTRARRFLHPERWDNSPLSGWSVIHGHTPTSDNRPDVAGEPPSRFNLDTGAVYGGKLTCGVFAPEGEEVRFMAI